MAMTITRPGAEAFYSFTDWQLEAANRGFTPAQAKQFWDAAHPSAPTPPPTPTPTPPPTPEGPNWGDISGYFDKALASLSGDTEKMYQQGKRRTLSDIAMQSVNAGMANTLNMPAAGIAYDEANRAQTNLALGTQKAGILTGLGQTAAGMYGQNLGAQTQRYGIDVGASSDAAQRALQQYIAQLQSSTSISQTAMSMMNRSQPSGGGSYFGSLSRV
jgi:hypothetical protein